MGRPELDGHLRELARAEGLSVEQYVRRLLAQVVHTGSGRQALALLQEWESEDATSDPVRLSGRTYARRISAMLEDGYRFHVVFLWLDSPEPGRG